MKKGKVSKTGYKKNSPDKHNDFNIIPSNKISMKNVEFPILGVSNLNDSQMMYPGNEYMFNGSSVAEFPLGKYGIKSKKSKYQTGGQIQDPIFKTKQEHDQFYTNKALNRLKTEDQGLYTKYNEFMTLGDTSNALTMIMAGGGIPQFIPKNEPYVPLNPTDFKNIGFKVNKPKGFRYATNQADEESITKKIKKGQDGANIPLKDQLNNILLKNALQQERSQKRDSVRYSLLDKFPKSFNNVTKGMLDYYKKEPKEYLNLDINLLSPDRRVQLLNKFQDGGMLFNESDVYGNQTPIQLTQNQQPYSAFDPITGMADPNLLKTVPSKQSLLSKIGGKLGGAAGIANTATGLIQGISMLKQEKDNRQQAKQFYQLSKVVNQAAGLPVDKPKRKYVRPEDTIINPNELTNTYGTGTNYLAKHGGKYQMGGFFPQASDFLTNIGGEGNEGNLGNMFGSAIGGGKGMPSGAGKIGSTVGGVAGSFLGPVGGVLGSFVGGAIGGLIGGKRQKETQRDQQRAYSQLQGAAFQQGTQNLHNQYTGFMKYGGNVPDMELGGDLQVYNGEAETISQNPYLPDGGETVMFKGPSHANGGMPIKYGNSPIEVEGGEPAVKLEHGGTGQDNLVVYGDMKIPSYGVTELQDPKAKNKKFKSYIKDLSIIEDKQNNIVEKGTNIVNTTEVIDSFDKLKFSSGKAMIEGGNMKLKEIANKKQIAAGIQNAILETADELGLKSDKLAEGKFRKAKSTNKAQDGTSIPRSQMSEYELYGYKQDPEDQNRMYRDLIGSSKTSTVPVNFPGKGSEQFNREFAAARKRGDPTFTFSGDGKLKTTDLFQGRTKTITTPGKTDRDYIYLEDDGYAPTSTASVENIPQEQSYTNDSGSDKYDWMNVLNSVLPMLRPSNQTPLSPNQLSGEMFALASNQLDPVQAQLYNPLLEGVSDVSYQDQLNANQADFNSLKKLTSQNPAAQAALAAQKYQANSSVLGEQFRQNQTQKMGVYNRNRGVLNDATLKNLAILDQQYVRQSQAKSNTKAVAQQALNSISDKIAKNKLENRTLGIYENLYNYRFGPKGYAWNMNPLAQFNTQGQNLPMLDENGNEITEDRTISTTRDRMGVSTGTKETNRRREKKLAKKGNGGIVKAIKGY